MSPAHPPGVTPDELITSVNQSESILRPIVENHDITEDRSKNRAESLMVGMRQIDSAIGFAVKGQHENVGESLVVVLWTVIDAPLERGDLRNLGLQGAKGLLDLLDVGGGCSVLELERDDMAQFALGLSGHGGPGESDQNNENENCQDMFHN